jgi:hypothetical protein
MWSPSPERNGAEVGQRRESESEDHGCCTHASVSINEFAVAGVNEVRESNALEELPSASHNNKSAFRSRLHLLPPPRGVGWVRRACSAARRRHEHGQDRATHRRQVRARWLSSGARPVLPLKRANKEYRGRKTRHADRWREDWNGVRDVLHSLRTGG